MNTAPLLIIALLSVGAVLQGFCTGQYVETGPYHIDGLVQEGDVFEYWCELPGPLEENQAVDITLRYSNAELVQRILAPRTIYGTVMVIYR